MTVKATREGLPGKLTASGYRVEQHVPFVALPSRAALYQWVLLSNGLAVDKSTQQARFVRAIVLDIGPWNEDDEAYVFGGARPQAESGIDKRGRKTNGAGIDLGERVWRDLQLNDNSQVTWRFMVQIPSIDLGIEEPGAGAIAGKRIF